MKLKEKIITTLWCLLVLSLFFVNFVTNKLIIGASEVYKIYLDGKAIGYITNEDELYDMINNKQKDIKKDFNVNNVYPPSNFQIVKTNSYTAVVEPVEKVYNEISELSTFTIEGYSINIKGNSDKEKDITIKVLDKSYFDEAIKTFIFAFIDESEYNAYMEDNQPEIETTGRIIESMFFDETITIKKDYIGVDENIFTNAKDLSQYLLFGDNAEIKSYTVKSGDTIASISNENKLNPKEFLVANPKYKTEDSLLTIGDEVNITLIKPVLSYSYDVHEVSDITEPFDEEIEYDYTKDSSYELITTAGVNGVTRSTSSYRVVNGETLAGARIIASEEITKKVNQVTVKGNPYGSNYGPGPGTYVDTGTKWQWPTNIPYIITSTYDYRWGTFHDGLDISGTGCGSPIYASETGTVYQSGFEPSSCQGGGECIVIGHSNGYYTMYAHMMLGSRLVFEGDQVQRGQVIGRMGDTGVASGCHLHFSVFNGIPWRTGSTFNPMLLWS